MTRPCNRYVQEALEFARRLTILADEGEAATEDDSCAVLYGMICDCAYKIRCRAEREREAHIARGAWQESEVSGETD